MLVRMNSPVSSTTVVEEWPGQDISDGKELHLEDEKEVALEDGKEWHLDPEKYPAFSNLDKEAAPDRGDGKQIIEQVDKELAISDYPRRFTSINWRKSWLRGRRRCALIASVLISITIVVAVTQTRQRISTGESDLQDTMAIDSPEIGGAVNPAYYSTIGLFNGTGLALSQAGYDSYSSDYYDTYIFAADYRGRIKQYRLFNSNGSISVVKTLATDARNATRISTVSYLFDEVATWHVFYVDQSGYVREKIATNTTGMTWQDGPLNRNSLKASDAELSTLQTCYWGSTLDDPDFYSGGIQGTNASNLSLPAIIMHLWYATNDTQLAQYTFIGGQSSWNYNRLWDAVNGRAGLGCETLLNETTSYVVLLDLENNVNIYWNDFNSSKVKTEVHPVNSWTKGNFFQWFTM